MKYILGLDVGIGSVGWAVVKDDNNLHNRIEDFGVRLFASGEVPNKNARFSQERRGYRSIRRLIRRRSHRKWRIKAHFENIGLCKTKDIDEYFETASPNIIALRVKALDEQITPQELAACLINICNRRGYKPFYDDVSLDEDKEAKENQAAIGKINEIFNNNNYRTVGEMIFRNDCFSVDNSEYKKYRNSQYDDAEEKILFSREMMKDEVSQILNKQSEYYSQLTKNNIDIIIDIIFSQRDFEDGPGDKEDKYRKYKGFLDSIGNCTFYKDEQRGSRFTLLADMYSLTNTLSQLIYTDIETGEIGLSAELAKELVDFALESGNIGKAAVKNISKKYGKEAVGYDGADFTNCFKFTKAIKPVFEKYGYNWKDIALDYLDENSLLNKVGVFLSENITPSRRESKYKQDVVLSKLDSDIVKELLKIKTKGTTNACYRFMRESIEAFLNGESYGSFQAKINKSIDLTSTNVKYKLLPAFDDTCEFADNPVVFRAINETRKIINAVIRKYGSPYAINIEVGSELNKSFEQRSKDKKKQNENEKNNKNAIAKISELLKIDESKVTPSMIERYKLGEEQGWQCLYSGEPINDMKEAILNTSHIFEVDHIVPFSLILDNTLKNKVLVYRTENDAKSQRTPLMYLSGDKEKKFVGRVNTIYGRKKEFKIKYKYLMLRDLYNSDLLSEWKSRNINDTRYISKYLVNYLKDTLEFSKDENEKYARQSVYAVKSAITSKLRRQWLNEKTWGVKEKDSLKKLTCLDHAVDAIVIANCIPAYVEIAALNQKLKDIYYSAGKVVNKEYNDTLKKAVETLRKYYGISEKISTELLTKKRTTPSFIPNLREEVEIRVFDCEMERYFRNNSELTDDELKETYRKKVMEFYSYDTAFASSLQMPLFSLKQDKKINKSMFDDNPLSIKTIEGVDYQIKSVNILNLKKKDIEQIYTNDKKLIERLNELMTGYKDVETIETALTALDQSKFIYNGRQVNRIKVKIKAPTGYFVKKISDDNYTVLNDAEYYCIEIYETTNGKTGACGIKRSNLVLEKGKLYLSPDYRYPDDFAKFVMYVYPGDYIKVMDDKKVVEGYYKGIKAITRNSFYISRYNCTDNDIFSITQKSKVLKYDTNI